MKRLVAVGGMLAMGCFLLGYSVPIVADQPLTWGPLAVVGAVSVAMAVWLATQ